MKKSLLFLSLIVLLAAGAVYLLLSRQQSQDVEKAPLFADLAGQAEDLTEIRISNHQGEIFVAKRTNGHWHANLPELAASYPTDQEKLADLVVALMEAKKIEAKTSQSKHYPRLGVEPVGTQDGQSVLVELLADKHNWQLLVGKTASSGLGSYVRLPDDKQSWLLDKQLSLPTSQQAWLQQPILNLAEDKVASVARLDAGAWTIFRNSAEDEHYQLEKMPKDRQIKYVGILAALVNNVLDLRFDALADPELVQQAKPVTELLISTFDQQNITLKLTQQDDNFYVTLSAALPGEDDYWHQIPYRVSSFSAGQLNKSIEDFLQEQEAESQPTDSGDEGEAPK